MAAMVVGIVWEDVVCSGVQLLEWRMRRVVKVPGGEAPHLVGIVVGMGQPE